jgi:1-acyl-sn-glycerol-3-phosphate acyltransferase
MFARFLRSSYRIPGFLLMSAWQLLRLRRIRNRTDGDREALHRFYLDYIRRVQRLMGIEVIQDGEPPEGPSLLMGNHRSYVDAVLMPSRKPVVFVARSESQHWPIIGWGATALNTIWVNRKDKDSRRQTRERVKERLANGYSIVIFPEGTTYTGPDIGEYRPSMFYIAAEGQFPITPVAIEYEDPNIAWVGNDWFIPHAWKHFGKRKIRVRVKFGQTSIPTDPERARQEMHAWATAETAAMRSAFNAERNKR